MLDRDAAIEILDFADAIRPNCTDRNGNISAIKFLEEFLPDQIENFVYEVVNDLRSERDPLRPISGFTKFQPTTKIVLDATVYDKALLWHPSSMFTLFHEGHHALKDNLSAERGIAGSGTSFKETPEQERKANFFAGSLLIPRELITKDTTVKDIMGSCCASLQMANTQLKIVRAVHPEKWSPGWNR